MEKYKKLSGGILGKYYDKVKNTLLFKIDYKEHAETYNQEQGEWNAEPEFSGKYIDICVKIYEEHGETAALDHATAVVESILENMRDDGYICKLKEGSEFINFGVWNQMFTLLGMLSYYRVTDDKKVLDACEKCIAYIMNHFVKKGYDILDCINNGTQHGCILFVLSDVYRYTKDEKYIRYMNYIISRFKNSDLNFLNFDNILDLRSKKGIEILIILLGILKYAEITGDNDAVKSVEKYWQQVKDTQIRNTGNGTLNEVWTENALAPAMLDGGQKPNETCVAVGWMELSLYLFKMTKKVQYLNALDRTLYNHILASISENGDDFAYYQPNFGRKVRTTGEGLYKCCRYRGFTLFTYMSDMLFWEDDSNIIPMLYTDCEYCSDGIKISEKTAYPFNGDLKFTIDSYKKKLLKLRVPTGYQLKSLKMNGTDKAYSRDEGYVIYELLPGEHYEIQLSLEPLINIETGNINGKRVGAISYGQVLLALSNKTPDVIIDVDNLAMLREESDNAYLTFKCNAKENGKNTQAVFTDYASADGYRVWFDAVQK